jgi:hypothetical protein
MFSVVKLKKSFWSAAGCAGYYFAFMHFLTRVGKYNCSARDWDGKDYLRIIPRVVLVEDPRLT